VWGRAGVDDGRDRTALWGDQCWISAGGIGGAWIRHVPGNGEIRGFRPASSPATEHGAAGRWTRIPGHADRAAHPGRGRAYLVAGFAPPRALSGTLAPDCL